MSLTPNYYRDRVCLNVLAGSKENAVDIYEAAEGHVLVGVLSKNYPDIPSAVADMQAYAKLIDNALSIGLGQGIRASPPWWPSWPASCSLSMSIRCSPGSGPAGRCSVKLTPSSMALSPHRHPRHGEDLHWPPQRTAD